MKTNNLQKKSFLMTMILALTAGFSASKSNAPMYSSPNGFVGGGSPIYTPRRGKMKGYLKENRRIDRGHGYMKYKYSHAR